MACQKRSVTGKHRTFLIHVLYVPMLVNIQASSVGQPYPRLFVELEQGERYMNYDLSIQRVFDMPMRSWLNYLDESIHGENAEVVCKAYGINYRDVVKLAAYVRKFYAP